MSETGKFGPQTTDAAGGTALPGNADVPVGEALPGTTDVPICDTLPGTADDPICDAPPGNADVLVGEGTPPATPAPRGWYTRGYLPHYDASHILQSVTFRLADSLPQQTLHQLEAELRRLPEHRREAARRQRIETWLDAGLGSCLLRHPEVADHLQQSLQHFHGLRYRLHAWCVMPNHVHVLLQPITPLGSIVQGWKSFSARWIRKHQAALGLHLPNGQPVWMREYWDRYIRDEAHYLTVVDYIHRNPVKAELCADPADWPWSSASATSSESAARAKAADEDVGVPRG